MSDDKHLPSCSCPCPECSPGATPADNVQELIKAAHESGDRIAELVPGSRERKWKWVNRKSPFLPFVAAVLSRPAIGVGLRLVSDRPQLFYRLVKLPELQNKGGNTTAGKGVIDMQRAMQLAESLRRTGMVDERKITSAVWARWAQHYPNTKRPSRRAISRHLTGK